MTAFTVNFVFLLKGVVQAKCFLFPILRVIEMVKVHILTFGLVSGVHVNHDGNVFLEFRFVLSIVDVKFVDRVTSLLQTFELI